MFNLLLFCPSKYWFNNKIISIFNILFLEETDAQISFSNNSRKNKIENSNALSSFNLHFKEHYQRIMNFSSVKDIYSDNLSRLSLIIENNKKECKYLFFVIFVYEWNIYKIKKNYDEPFYERNIVINLKKIQNLLN